MALEPGVGLLSSSPTSSGRQSPVPLRRAGQRGEEEPGPKDKAFRRYAAGVERALSLFETAFEDWADYISFLGRLLKSLQAHPPNCKVVPVKGIVAKRLAQCLNPELPSGVHQKALEVYSFICSLIGRDNLSNDLPLYLPGLSSTLSFASLSVRSPFLALLETHFLKLDSAALRPALKAIILALLPGLEEETSEDFERTLKILNGFKSAVRSIGEAGIGAKEGSGDEYFWQCFFLAAITSNNRRLGALAYLTRHLPKLGGAFRRGSITSATNGSNNVDAEQNAQDTAMVTSPEPGLLLRCFAAGLGDDQILIQRGFLDLLVTHLPLHAMVLQNRVKSEDLELLMVAASGVVARRDMSLNRRLWTWLLGPEPAAGTDGDGTESPSSVTADPMQDMAASRTQYFEDYGIHPLTRALLKMIQKDTISPTERARPYRICLSLMDRWEIGGLIVPEIFLPVVDSVRRYKEENADKEAFKEVLRSASVFFDGVESGLIWGEILSLLAEALGPSKLTTDVKIEKLKLVQFILAHFNVREEEMLVVHAPMTTLAILAMIRESEKSASSGGSNKTMEGVLNLSVTIANLFIDLVPERAFQPRTSTTSTSTDSSYLSAENNEILSRIRKFYVNDQGNLDVSEVPFTTSETTSLIARETGRLAIQSLNGALSSADVAAKARVLVALLSKAPKTSSIDNPELLTSIFAVLNRPQPPPFSILTSIVSLVTTLYGRSYILSHQYSDLVDPIVKVAWFYLSPSFPKYHVETARILWQLQTSLPSASRDVEAAICDQMIRNGETGNIVKGNADPGRRFAILWTHIVLDNPGHLDRRGSRANGDLIQTSTTGLGPYEIMLGRPIFLILDALLDERTQLFVIVRTWLQSLSGIDKLFHLFVAKFSDFSFLKTPFTEQSADNSDLKSLDDSDLNQCLYYLQKLSSTLRWSSDKICAALAENTISTDKSYQALFQITGHDGEMSLQDFFVHVCLCAISCNNSPTTSSATTELQRIALTVLHQIFMSPYSAQLIDLHIEHKLIELLQGSLINSDPFIQVSLLDVLLAVLRMSSSEQQTLPPSSPGMHRRVSSQDSTNGFKAALRVDVPSRNPPPPSLIKCLQAAFISDNSRPVLDSWISFLAEVIPLYTESIFQILIPLVGTLCEQVSSTFVVLQNTFKGSDMKDQVTPESTLIALLNGLEQILARSHDRLRKDEARVSSIKSPDQPQGFFGNMVSGVFASDAPQTRSQNANNRLTVLLSFQDAVRISFLIWCWGGAVSDGSNQDVESAASFSYTSLRMRNRARRLLEHLFAAEALECLETVIEIWQQNQYTNSPKASAVFDLLQVLDGSRPKYTIPAIFDAVYSRTNPGALDASRKSTLTAELQDTDLGVFLVEYARSLEDDTMDEIWVDCMTFLKDILTNPFPHRQILPSLLEFSAILGEKVDNTNFGEQKKMRRELGDLFLRLLTATFTTKPISFQEPNSEKQVDGSEERGDDIVSILASITPNLIMVLVEPERVLSAANTISASVVGPTFKSKSFPENVSKHLLDLLYQIARLPGTQKAWKKDLSDAFNDARFFNTPTNLLESNWLPLLRQWCLSDKERMTELLSRLTPPTTAGIVFGVGATSARLEADRKTQLNLRRISTLILASAEDTFVTELVPLEVKIVELLTATPTSSPSSTTRAEIFMVLRALALKTSPIHLAPLWPTINAELHTAISSVVASDHSTLSDTYNNHAVLQACKLLDTLLCIAPDDFQLHEWLYVTDTIDAVYRPADHHPIGLIDELAEELGSSMPMSATYNEHISSSSYPTSTNKEMRRPLLGAGGIECGSGELALDRKDELVGKVLRPFFSQLSIYTFERTYEMGSVDWDILNRGLLEDLGGEGVVGAL